MQTAAVPATNAPADSEGQPILGFEKSAERPDASRAWRTVSARRLRVGLAGYGVCKFGAAFGFQDHPNVEVVAVSDPIPDCRADLSKAARCPTAYETIDELVTDDKVEAVFIATDAPSHARHSIEALRHGKHVASAVPACFGSVEEGDRLFEAVKSSGLTYMMFETSCFQEDLYAMRQIYRAGAFGRLVFTEGEYYHYCGQPLDSYRGWRIGLPPQWYPTHSNAYYIGVTGASFTEVSCFGVPGTVPHLMPQNNAYGNPFGTEIAMFRTSDGGTARMAVSWDTPGFGVVAGRTRGEKGSFHNGAYQGSTTDLPDLKRPPLPPGVDAGGHGGSHGRLTDEFVSAVLENRRPLVDIAQALNMTVSGIVAHQSALKDGELLKIPQYRF